MTKELVVAAYDKNLDWLNKIYPSVRKTVYRKGDALPLREGEFFVEPNLGRCVHTFFNHLLLRYDSLSDYTFFCQDFPFDHWGNVVQVVNGDTSDIKNHASLVVGGYYGFHNNRFGTAWNMVPTEHFDSGKSLVCLGDGYPHHMGLDIGSRWERIFDCPKPEYYEFIPGGHFGVTRDQVRARSKKFYENICDILLTDPVSPWIFERLECYFFCEKYRTKY